MYFRFNFLGEEIVIAVADGDGGDDDDGDDVGGAGGEDDEGGAGDCWRCCTDCVNHQCVYQRLYVGKAN